MSRDELLDSALRSLNHDPGASMGAIAEAMGVSRATLNRHFASRDALLLEIAERGLDRWERSLTASGVEQVIAEGGSPDAIRGALREMIHRYVEDAEIFGFILTETRVEEVAPLEEQVRSIERREQAMYAAAQQAGVLRKDLTPQWISWSVFGLLVATRDGLRFGDLARRGIEDVVVSTFFEGCQS